MEGAGVGGGIQRFCSIHARLTGAGLHCQAGRGKEATWGQQEYGPRVGKDGLPVRRQ